MVYASSLLPYGVIHFFVGDPALFYVGSVFGVLIVCIHVYNLLFELSEFQKFAVGLILSVLHFFLLLFLCFSAKSTDFIWLWFYPGALIFYCISPPFFASIFSLILLPIIYITFSPLLGLVELSLFLSVYILLVVFAHVASFKICSDKEKLTALIRTDNITGLQNHLALDRMIRNSKAPWFFRKIKNIKSVIYFDIDELKKIDDIYGHSVNDIIMQRLTRLVQHTLKDTEYFYRDPSKGFILFSEKGEEIIEDAKNLRKVVHETYIFDEAKSISITCGVAFRSANESIESVMLEAYEALIKSKRLECKDGICLPESCD